MLFRSDKGVVKENKSRIQHDYKIGDKVLYTKPGIIPKMEQPRTGPFTVRQVHVNGTTTIEKGAATGRAKQRACSWGQQHLAGASAARTAGLAKNVSTDLKPACWNCGLMSRSNVNFLSGIAFAFS